MLAPRGWDARRLGAIRPGSCPGRRPGSCPCLRRSRRPPQSDSQNRRSGGIHTAPYGRDASGGVAMATLGHPLLAPAHAPPPESPESCCAPTACRKAALPLHQRPDVVATFCIVSRVTSCALLCWFLGRGGLVSDAPGSFRRQKATAPASRVGDAGVSVASTLLAGSPGD